MTDFFFPLFRPFASGSEVVGMLNPSQAEAVHASVGDPLIIVAPPGSGAPLFFPPVSVPPLNVPPAGKTHCLISRIQFLVESGIAPSAILALTFTNKAAREMMERVCQRGLPGGHDPKKILLTTFHSFCLRLCRTEGFIAKNCTIWADAEQKRAMRQILTSRLQKEDAQADVSAAALAPLVAQMGALLGRPASDFAQGSDERSLVQAYARMKEQQNAIDFDDMLGIVVARLAKMSPQANPLRRYAAVLVDEWQDTSRTQLELVKYLAKQTRGLTVVGDPHQSIYGFRGADFGNWKRLKELLKPRVVFLSTNYRSTGVVSAVCQGLISYNPVPRLQDGQEDLPAVLTVKKERDPVSIVQCRDGAGEADFVAHTMLELHEKHDVSWSDMCVLYRSNPRQRVSRVLEMELIRRRVPYSVVAGQALYDVKCIKYVLAYLRFLLNERDEMAFDVVAKQCGFKKDFEAAWKAYRGSATSWSALQRLAGGQVAVVGC